MHSDMHLLIDHQRDTSIVSYARQSLKIWHGKSGVTDTFDVNGFGVLIYMLCELLRIVALHKLDLDAKSWEKHLELVVRATV